MGELTPELEDFLDANRVGVLATSDQAAAWKFYGDQFGWKKGDVMPMGDMGDYEFLTQNGQTIGAFMRKDPDKPSRWRYYFGVGDIDVAADTVKKGGGSIVHIASDTAIRGIASIAAYSVTKAGMRMLSDMLALEGAPVNVRSNAVCPGDTLPGMVTTTSGREEYGDTGDWRTPPMGRIGTAQDVAAVVSFLLSPDSSFVNGTALLIDGGMRASYRAWEAAR